MKLFLLFLIIGCSYAQNCSLFYNEMKIEVKTIKNGCEFPEGNIVKCAQIISHVKRQNPKVGALVFRENVNFKSFCLVGKKQKIPGTKLQGRLVSDSERSDLYALMECPTKKNVVKIHLYNQNKTKQCSLSF